MHFITLYNETSRQLIFSTVFVSYLFHSSVLQHVSKIIIQHYNFYKYNTILSVLCLFAFTAEQNRRKGGGLDSLFCQVLVQSCFWWSAVKCELPVACSASTLRTKVGWVTSDSAVPCFRFPHLLQNKESLDSVQVLLMFNHVLFLSWVSVQTWNHCPVLRLWYFEPTGQALDSFTSDRCSVATSIMLRCESRR